MFKSSNKIKTRFAQNLTFWQMSPELEKILDPIEKDIKAGRNIIKFINSAKEIGNHFLI